MQDPSDQPFANEAWWERELYRNQKLMDRYQQVFEEEGEAAFEKYDTPEKLFYRVHFGVQPGDPLPPEALADLEKKRRQRQAEIFPDEEGWEDEAGSDESPAELFESDREKPGMEDFPGDGDDDEDIAGEEDLSCDSDADMSAEEDTLYEDDFDEEIDGSEEENLNYPALVRSSRDFALRVMAVERGNCPFASRLDDIFYLSAMRIGSDLAGGHGHGYDEFAICANIVRCRWALSNALVVAELLEPLTSEFGEARELRDEALALAERIRERIRRLRQRVWWETRTDLQ